MTAVTHKKFHECLKKHAYLSSPPAHDDDALKEAMRGPQPSLATQSRSSLLSDDKSEEDIDRGDPIIPSPVPSECSKSRSEEKVLQKDLFLLFPPQWTRPSTPPWTRLTKKTSKSLHVNPILLQINGEKPFLPDMPGENYHGQACILSPPKNNLKLRRPMTD